MVNIARFLQSYVLPHEIIGPNVVCGFSCYLLALSFNGSNMEMYTVKPLNTSYIIKHIFLSKTDTPSCIVIFKIKKITLKPGTV